MKVFWLIILCSITVITLTGCQNPQKGVEVVVQGQGTFPESLAGTWKADKNGWEVVIEKDGIVWYHVCNRQEGGLGVCFPLAG